MNTLVFVILAIAVIGISVFLVSDADLGLYLRSDPPAGAFADQVIWIVGASSGIGAGLAMEYAQMGAQVIISARRESQLQALAAECAKVGPKPLVLVMDVTDHSTHQQALEQVLTTYGQIDQLVLNAGRAQRNLAMSTTLEVTREIMELNFFSLIALNKLVVPHMTARQSGRVVVMSSVSGLIGTPAGSSYSASKFALHGYFNALRAEVAGDDVHVTIVCPGPVESEILTVAYSNPDYPPQATGKIMATARCAQLTVRGVYHGLSELWIADQPVLLMAYLAAYAPALCRGLFVKILGPARIKALQGGQNVYDFKKQFTGLFKKG